MAKQRPEYPPILVAPNGKRYKATVMLINTYDKERPKNLSILHDEQSIELSGGEHFLIAYVSEDMLIEGRKTRPDLI